MDDRRSQFRYATKHNSLGASEETVRTFCCDVPCQIRIDWFSCEYGIVDLKTSDSLKWFEADCKPLFAPVCCGLVEKESTITILPKLYG